MITLDAVRAAMLSPQPYDQLDALVRAELGRGRTTDQIVDDIRPFIDTALDTPGLTEEGEEAFLSTLDALTGNCRADQCYQDPPNNNLPSEEEIAALPRWARVAFAARCARRVLPLFTRYWGDAPLGRIHAVHDAVDVAERSAEIGMADRIFRDADTAGIASMEAPHAVGDGAAAFSADRAAATAYDAAAAAAYAGRDSLEAWEDSKKIASVAPTNATAASRVIADVQPFIRRDFDRLARLTEWQKWTDDTPVPPDVFGPLWPEGPPPGWPADPDVPQRADLTIELLSRAKLLERMTEDEAVNLFNAFNAYYIARTGDRLTLEGYKALTAVLETAGV